jgi:hypothetical protein
MDSSVGASGRHSHPPALPDGNAVETGLQFGHRQPRATCVNHSTAVGTNQMQVCKLGLCSRMQLVNRKVVVDFHEAVTPLPVRLFEIEITCLAGQFTCGSETVHLFGFDQLP